MASSEEYAHVARKRLQREQDEDFVGIVERITDLITKRINGLNKSKNNVVDATYVTRYSELMTYAAQTLSVNGLVSILDAAAVFDSAGNDIGMLIMQRMKWIEASNMYKEFTGSTSDKYVDSADLRAIAESYDEYFRKAVPTRYGFTPNHVSDTIPEHGEELFHLIKYDVRDNGQDILGMLQRLAMIDVNVEDLVVYKMSNVPKGEVHFKGIFNNSLQEFEVRKVDTSIFIPTMKSSRTFFPVVTILREMLVISKKMWFDGNPPGWFFAYGLRVGTADVASDQFPVRFIKLECLDKKDQNYMGNNFRPVSMTTGNVGSIASELLNPKYRLNYAQVAFRSGEMLLELHSRYKKPVAKTIHTAATVVLPKKCISIAPNRFAALNLGDGSDSERSTTASISWADDIEREEREASVNSGAEATCNMDNPTPAESLGAVPKKTRSPPSDTESKSKEPVKKNGNGSGARDSDDNDESKDKQKSVQGKKETKK